MDEKIKVIEDVPEHIDPDEARAKADADVAAFDAHKRENPTGDAEEDAFLRVFRSAMSDATPVMGAGIGMNSRTLGKIQIDFHDPNARQVVVRKLTIDGTEVPLSAVGKEALLNIVQEERKAAALDQQAKAKSAALNAIIKKAGA